MVMELMVLYWKYKYMWLKCLIRMVWGIFKVFFKELIG